MTVFSHAIEILRQGVWASLTGGWYYDPKKSKFCNTAHMYMWLLLFTFPLILSLCFTLNCWTISVYCMIVFIFFAALKSINLYLHSIFDTHLAMEKDNNEAASREPQG